MTAPTQSWRRWKHHQCRNSKPWPSWRMIVQLTGTTEAYGVYPGGQNGKPRQQVL
ncbi:MAG: penicillin acylase family protein [Chitinophagaceae bacterium]|nr:penicillin acylase family protein [Chitinophagaceae bacterium]